MKVDQEINIRPTENVGLKREEDSGSSLSLGALKMIFPPLVNGSMPRMLVKVDLNLLPS